MYTFIIIHRCLMIIQVSFGPQKLPTAFFHDEDSGTKPISQPSGEVYKIILSRAILYTVNNKVSRSLKIWISEHKRTGLKFESNSKNENHVRECHH